MQGFLLAALCWIAAGCNAFSASPTSRGHIRRQNDDAAFNTRLYQSNPVSSSSSPATTTESQSTESSKTLTLFSPCKINLFLRILDKRPDGYHNLASLFQAVGFGDTLELSLLSNDDSNNTPPTQDTFTCNMPGVPVDSSNLVLRALQLIRDKTNHSTTFFQANLWKQVPAQAGLGGGSANAATALWAANQLLGQPASLPELVEWSGALGSDITFFLSQGTAYCTGRGEVITAMDDPPLKAGTPVCLVKPNVGLSTPAVFQALDYNELSDLDPNETLLPAFMQHADDLSQVPSDYLVNDLELPAFRVVPALHELKTALLQHGFPHVLMSGSGTSIFCLGEPRDEVKFRQEFLEDRKDDVQVFRSEFIHRQPGEWYQQPGDASAAVA
jgi:4-diphosphocytidyl-2-C-methyl-D-erythritol kinase